MEDNKNKQLTKKKIILRISLFVIIFLLGFVYLNVAFKFTNSDSNKQIFNAFYGQQEDTVDVIYMGTSATNRYFIGPKCYDDTGITTFNVATMGMPMFFEPILIEEVEKYQDPDLYIFELRWTLKTKDMITDAHIRRVTDSMKYGENRRKAINKALDFTEGADTDISMYTVDYYVPIIKYHGMLTSGSMCADDFLLRQTENETKGYVMTQSTVTVKEQKPAVLSDERAPLSKEAEATLKELLSYIKENNKNALFVLSPYSIKEGDKAKFNTAMDMVAEAGYPVIDFNTEEMYEELGIDWKMDFYNSKHVNFMGAEKYTEYLTEYISENYELKDHRDDDKYRSWDVSYDEYLKYICNNNLRFK